ncbi:MAG: M3 family oligoendopeptidase [Candidatus Adiutrix sp.]|jgi:oligoendopeptidase F|nr:M3 family oligoendopeptidase [Candidatus Adiutrix sp.]
MTVEANVPTSEDQIPQWDLSQLYSLDSPALQNDLAALDRQAADFSLWRARLEQGRPSADEFRELLGALEDLTRLAHRLAGFASLAFAQNTQDQKALAFMARMDEKMADLGNELLFFEIWWKELPGEEAGPLIAARPDFAYWLSRTRALRPHTLPEPQERVINLKNSTGSDALIALYDSISNRYRFRQDFMPQAGPELTRDQLMVHVRSADPAVRAGAYRELYRVFGQDGPILGQIYQTRVRDWRIENIRLRHYERPADVRHKANDLSPAAVEALLNCTRRNISLFGDFFRLKARVLGLGEQLRRYDLYAPLTADRASIDFSEGLSEVLKAFKNFSPRFADLASRILAEKRFSARPGAGKQGGAFCYSMLPADSPWVLMTYNGRRQDLFTMAHELGHAVHSQLAAEHNVFHFHATLPLAETASTFGEMLLADRLRRSPGSAGERADLLFNLLDDAYATVGRQAFFAFFEIRAHEMIEAGATVDELAEAYLENLALQFGDAVTIADEFRWEWVSIPHIFHTPFYVYAYSFGQLLVYSLWRQYQAEGPAFVPRLTALLARGGSAPPEEILAESGLGPLDENFWQGGFEVIRSLLDELKLAL